MTRARKMCASCPFRLRISEVERQELAALRPDEFPCHTEDGYLPGSSGVQCRGHWQAVRWSAGLTPSPKGERRS